MAEKFVFKFFGMSVEAEGAKSISVAARLAIYGLIAAAIIFIFGAGRFLSWISILYNYFSK